MTEIIENISLKPYNTFGIDVKARWLTTFAGYEDLGNLLATVPESRRILVLGGGSNILLKGNFDGLVLVNQVRGIDIVREDDDHVYVRAGAGVSWHGFVTYALSRDWAGVENLSLIPGNVGAAPMQNIGAYGVEIKEVFHELSAWSLEDRSIRTFGLRDCAFGYRESIFKRQLKGQFIILDVTFRLSKRPTLHIEYGAIREELEKMDVSSPTIRDVSKAVIHIRRSKLPDPAVIGNAGSFFKNPTVSTEEWQRLSAAFSGIVGYPVPEGMKLAAGWLIQQCGWKGYRKGDAGCHAQQALVLVNYGHASGGEIYDLSEEILQSVKARFGVDLEREVNIIG